MYHHNGTHWYEQFLQVGRLYTDFDLAWFSSLSSERLCIFGLNAAMYFLTSSSAVAKRPRDVSCLSVVSFVASIVQLYLKRSFFIISYFSFGFTSAASTAGI